MPHFRWAVFASWLMLAGLGCGSHYQPAPLPSPPSPSPTAIPPAPVSARTAKVAVRLSTGVALAQTGPQGTMMGFSADYEAVGAFRGAKFVWVLERTGGTPIRIETPLKSSGTLQTLVPWRSEDGPFKTHVEDTQGMVLSDSLELRQD